MSNGFVPRESKSPARERGAAKTVVTIGVSLHVERRCSASVVDNGEVQCAVVRTSVRTFVSILPNSCTIIQHYYPAKILPAIEQKCTKCYDCVSAIMQSITSDCMLQ